MAKIAPVRAKPVITSSTMNTRSCLSQVRRNVGKYSGGGTTAPDAAPVIGSQMMPAMLSGSSWTSTRSNAFAQATPQSGYVLPHGQR
jgi:hypothetical protein